MIIKLLGRKIGYKTLERLKQMCVRKGVISIINQSNNYCLVAFTHDDNKNATLVDGPMFIYDHYLSVKDWSPKFQPGSDTIENVAVWIQISGLRIEYYDARVLSFIENRVGKTVKVYKTTIQQEREKYVRLYVEVSLTKPLITTFSIKWRIYKLSIKGYTFCLNIWSIWPLQRRVSGKNKKETTEEVKKGI